MPAAALPLFDDLRVVRESLVRRGYGITGESAHLFFLGIGALGIVVEAAVLDLRGRREYEEVVVVADRAFLEGGGGGGGGW